MIKQALFDLGHTLRAHICISFGTGDTEDDVEMAESFRRVEAEEPGTISSEIPTKVELQKALQSAFSEADCVDQIMKTIDYWEYVM